MIGKYISLAKKVILCLLLGCVLSIIFWSFSLLLSKEDSVGVELNADIEVDNNNLIVNAELSNNSDEDINNIELSVYEPSGYYGLSEGSSGLSHKESLDSGSRLCFSTQFKMNDTSCTNNILTVKRFNKLVVCIKLLAYILIVSLVVLVVYKYKIKLILLFILFVNFVYSRDLYLYTKSTQDIALIHSIDKNLWVKDEEGKRVELLLKATYTDSKFTQFIDNNNNSVPDCYEHLDFLKDTDGDGLVDYVEVCILGTSPFMLDTYKTGLGDSGYDTDKDGLSNLLELQLGTNLVKKDTDYDGLEDNREVELGTDPLDNDTDKDGLSDGLEVEYGYDPLIQNDKFNIIKEFISEGINSKDTIIVRVAVEATGEEVETLGIDTYESMLLNKDIPGYIGSAFELDMLGFSSCQLSFELDESWFRGNREPCIYYFNEDTQLLEEVDCEINGNCISADIEHFSVYIVLDKTEVVKWMERDMFIQERIPGFESIEHNVDISFVIDVSHSMTENDEKDSTSEVVNKFADSLALSLDRVSLVVFTKTAKILCNFTNDITGFKGLVAGIKRDSGKETDSGSNIYGGVLMGLKTFDEETLNRKYVVLVTDGESTYSDISLGSLIKQLQESKVSVYCVHINNRQNDIVLRELRDLCEKTGGRYYNIGDIDGDGLSYEFSDIEEKIVGVDKDSNDDGLTDYETDLIVESKLTTGTGLGVDIFKDKDLGLLCEDADIDKDGLKNGEEIEVVKLNNLTYVKINSSPFDKDTDRDGMLDGEDDAPLLFGKKGGIVGELYIVAHKAFQRKQEYALGENSKDNWLTDWIAEKNITGHAWIVFKSYVDKDFTRYNRLDMGYLPIIIDNHIRYIAKHDLSPYHIEAGSCMSFGYTEVGDTGSVGWEDGLSDEEIADKLVIGEVDKLEPGLLLNSEYAVLFKEASFSLRDSSAMGIQITEEELEKFLYYSNFDINYNVLFYNCTDYAIEAWNLVAGQKDKIGYDTQIVPWFYKLLLPDILMQKKLWVPVAVPDFLKLYIDLSPKGLKNFEIDMLSDIQIIEPKIEFRTNKETGGLEVLRD